MRQALIKYNTVDAGILTETDQGTYTFDYLPELSILNMMKFFE